MPIRIDRAALDALLASAAASPDAEICGLLFGEGDRIDRVASVANVAAPPADTFEIDPATLVAAHRAERAGGPRLIGCYHSHPRGPAAPSPRDAAAAEPGRLWLILGEGKARAWRLSSAGFQEQPLVVL